MKRVLPVLIVLLPLVAGCKKSTPAAAAPAPQAGAPTAAVPAGGPAGSPATPAQMPDVKPVPAELPAVVARVNGESISRDELQAAMASVEARAGRPVPAEQRSAFTRQVLDQLVDFHVLSAEAKARKVAVADAEVQSRINQMKQGFPNEQAFQQALQQQHVTLQQLLQQAKTGMEIDKLVDTEISSKIAVQDNDVNTFYQQNVERFKQDESVHASHILIGVPQNADPKQKAEAKAKAEGILKQIRGGGDFAKIAREQSQDPGSAQNGGDLGFFPKGQMEPSFETAAFALKPGAVSGIVETPFGFHIIKSIERRGPRTAPFEEVSAEIKQFLAEQQRESKLQQFVAQAKGKMKVEILI